MVKNETFEIVRLLMQKSEPMTIREISLKREINYKSAYEALMKLEKEGAVNITKKGNTKLCVFSKKLTKTTCLVEMQKTKDLTKIKDIKVIYEELLKIPNQFIALIFGSYAKNSQTKESDIDLLIISKDSEEIVQKLSWIPKKIDFTNINYEEFLEMLNSKKFNVVNEAIKNNTILIGIDDYYRFLNYVNP